MFLLPEAGKERVKAMDFDLELNAAITHAKDLRAYLDNMERRGRDSRSRQAGDLKSQVIEIESALRELKLSSRATG